MKKDAVILIPSYEPDSLLVNTVKSLVDEGFNVLVVNDGSGSEFDPIFDEVKPLVKYLKQEPNKGKGAAMKLGYKNVLELYPETKYIITADGDGQHATEDIVRVYELLKEKDELVFGVRHFDKKVPFRSRFGNDWSKFNRSLLTKQYIPDDQCGLRGFPIRYLDELIKIRGNRYEYEMNEIVSFQLKQYPIYIIPIETIYLNNNSRSHFSPFLDTCRIQGKILFHAIPALIFNALLIASLLFMYSRGYTAWNTVIILMYTIYSLLYYLTLSVVHPSKLPFRRLAKEELFSIIRAAWCYILVSGVTLIKVPYQVSIPAGVILSSGLNVLLSWAFRKMYTTQKN